MKRSYNIKARIITQMSSMCPYPFRTTKRSEKGLIKDKSDRAIQVPEGKP